MFKKLEEMEARYRVLQDEMQSLSTGDQSSDKKIKCLKEFSYLSKVMDVYKKYKEKNNNFTFYKKLIAEDKEDKDFILLAKEEIVSIQKELNELDKELKKILIPSDSLDEKDVVVEIRPAAGGDEAGLFCQDLFSLYSHFAEKKKWKKEILSISHGNNGGLKEIIFSLSGKNVYGDLKYESGVHRVQRVPQTESQGRVHTSTVTVVVLPSADEMDISIQPSDLRVDVFRSSGAGGQHVNTTDSAVRIVHMPTKVVVQCQDEKSQHSNKQKAMKVLYARLYDLEMEKKKKKESQARLSQIGTGDRSEKVRTYNFPQSRVTDHRLGKIFYLLNQIMKGDLQNLIESLKMKDMGNILASQSDKK